MLKVKNFKKRYAIQTVKHRKADKSYMIIKYSSRNYQRLKNEHFIR